jgi:CRP/FNR family transcriptional regulator, nitrogen fixation regulation protein
MYLAHAQTFSGASRLAPLTAADDLMSQMGVSLQFERDEEIYGQEEQADMIYRVVKGAVRTIRVTADGRRQIGDFYYPGDLFGVEPGEQHVFSAEALCQATILVLKRSALNGAAGAEVERMIWTAASRELGRAHQHVLLLGRKSACEKVATFLLSLIARTTCDGAHLSMGRQDMADYLGLTIETVSRMMSQLQASAIIELVGLRDFRVRNPRALAKLAG